MTWSKHSGWCSIFSDMSPSVVAKCFMVCFYWCAMRLLGTCMFTIQWHVCVLCSCVRVGTWFIIQLAHQSLSNHWPIIANHVHAPHFAWCMVLCEVFVWCFFFVLCLVFFHGTLFLSGVVLWFFMVITRNLRRTIPADPDPKQPEKFQDVAWQALNDRHTHTSDRHT